MKSLLLFLISTAVSIASGDQVQGKYLLELNNHLSGASDSFELLLNSQGELKFLDEEGDNYYLQNYSVSQFFGDFNFDIFWGRDEDRHYFLFSIAQSIPTGEVIIKNACSLYIDAPNSIHSFNETSMSLKKWNSETKTFILLKDETASSEQEACRDELKKIHSLD